jgi:CubicO group peptidase (beta-lactamase class C family)
MTKLMTAVAALQCVSRGQISLDDEVETLLPELKDPDVLEGFEDDVTPILVKARAEITLRCVSSSLGSAKINRPFTF